jgi:hypothetical protein
MREAMSVGDFFKKGFGMLLMSFGVSANQKKKPRPAAAKPAPPK